MPRLALLRLAAVGLALVVPASARADGPGLFGRNRHVCPDCQLKQRMKADGLTTPPPTVVQGTDPTVVADCAACQAAAGGASVVVAGPGAMPGQVIVGGEAPGYASVGGPALGAEPSPIGVYQASYRPDPGMGLTPAAPGRATVGGPAIPSAIPPAPTPMGDAHGHNTPFLSRLLYMPRRSRLFEARNERRREQHAMLRYETPDQSVSDLPASMVFGRGAR